MVEQEISYMTEGEMKDVLDAVAEAAKVFLHHPSDDTKVLDSAIEYFYQLQVKNQFSSKFNQRVRETEQIILMCELKRMYKDVFRHQEITEERYKRLTEAVLQAWEAQNVPRGFRERMKILVELILVTKMGSAQDKYKKNPSAENKEATGRREQDHAEFVQKYKSSRRPRA
jgi:hypothetical protein